MSELKNKLESIKQEKDSKIVAENIKSGVSIFNVEGSYKTPIEETDEYSENLELTKQILGEE